MLITLQEVLQPAVVAFQEWRGTLLSTGVIQDYCELHTANPSHACTEDAPGSHAFGQQNGAIEAEGSA